MHSKSPHSLSPSRWRLENRYMDPRDGSHLELRETLRCSLDFASICVKSSAHERIELRRAFLKFVKTAAEHRHGHWLTMRAIRHQCPVRLSNALMALRGEARYMQLRWSRASCHHRLTLLMRGIVRWRYERRASIRLLAQRREQAAQRRKTLVQLHARLLLWNWRRAHGTTRAALRASKLEFDTFVMCRTMAKWTAVAACEKETRWLLSQASDTIRARVLRGRIGWGFRIWYGCAESEACNRGRCQLSLKRWTAGSYRRRQQRKLLRIAHRLVTLLVCRRKYVAIAEWRKIATRRRCVC